MIEGRHFRNVEARRRTLAEAIDRYLVDEVPKKRNGSMHRFTLPWWKDAIGNLKLADVTPAILVEQRAKIGRETYRRADPESKRTTLEEGEQPRQFKRSAATVNRYLACLSHVLTVARREWHWISHSPWTGSANSPKAAGACATYRPRNALAYSPRRRRMRRFIVSSYCTLDGCARRRALETHLGRRRLQGRAPALSHNQERTTAGCMVARRGSALA